MRDSSPVPSTAISPPSTSETKERGGLDFRDYQELKNGIHRYLLNKVELEKVAAEPDERTRSQVLAVIQNLVRLISERGSAILRQRQVQ